MALPEIPSVSRTYSPGTHLSCTRTRRSLARKRRPKLLTLNRQPAFLDKHFSKELKLLRMERLPSLVHDITAIVDRTTVVQFPPSCKFYSANDMNCAAPLQRHGG